MRKQGADNIQDVKHFDSDLTPNDQEGNDRNNVNTADNDINDFKEFIEEVNDNVDTDEVDGNVGFPCGQFECRPPFDTCCYNSMVHAYVCGFTPCPQKDLML